MSLVFADAETRSTADLKVIGGRAYAEHPHTQVLCLGVLYDDTYHLWIPAALYDGPLVDERLRPDSRRLVLHRDQAFPFAEWLGDTWVGHNFQDFDRHILRRLGFEPRCYDTLPAARASGLPGKLDEIGKTLFDGGKDEGQRFLKKLSFGEVRDGEPVYPPVQQGYLEAVCRYCLADVALLKKLYDVVAGAEEPRVLAVHNQINDRGIAFDRGLAATLCRLSSEAVSRANEEIVKLTDGKLENPRSQQQTLKWVNSYGIYLWRPDGEKQSLDKRLVERFLADPEGFQKGAEEAGACVEVPERVARVLKLRQTALRQLTPKLEAAMQAVSADGRIRDLFVYHGAHTGRWTSHRVQIHNLAKGVETEKDDPKIIGDLLAAYDAGMLCYSDILEACERFRAAKSKRLGRDAPAPTPDDVLTTLIRPCFYGDPGLWVADYAGVEARWIAWWAGQSDLVEQFRQGLDVYCTMASTLFGRVITKADKKERQLGKTIILGCGFGMGVVRFAAYCAQQGIDLAALGVTAKQCIDTYRATYPAIPRIWRAADDAVKRAVRGTPSEVNGIECYMDGRHLQCRLHSGRRLVYRNARIELLVPPYCKALGLPETPKPTVCYDSPKGWADSLFGGKEAENWDQAECNDFMRDAMLRVPDIVVHVHDEVGSETREYGQLPKIMCQVPSWAGGFPLEIEWHYGRRYVKDGLPSDPHGKEKA